VRGELTAFDGSLSMLARTLAAERLLTMAKRKALVFRAFSSSGGRI
jgi:hypothetical protein